MFSSALIHKFILINQHTKRIYGMIFNTHASLSISYVIETMKAFVVKISGCVDYHVNIGYLHL